MEGGLKTETRQELEDRMERIKIQIKQLSRQNAKILLVGHRVYFRLLTQHYSFLPTGRRLENAELVKHVFKFKR